MLLQAVRPMSKPKKPKSKSNRQKWTDATARKTLLPVPSDTAPTDERQARTFSYSQEDTAGKIKTVRFGNGLKVLDAEISPGGIAVGQAVQNTLECTLDLLYKAGVLNSDKDETIGPRRYLAGLEIRKIYEQAEITSGTTATYDKAIGMGRPGEGVYEKSDHADMMETKLRRLTRSMGKYAQVVTNTCCMDESMPSRHNPALLAGLDALADALWGDITIRNRPIRSTSFD